MKRIIINLTIIVIVIAVMLSIGGVVYAIRWRPANSGGSAVAPPGEDYTDEDYLEEETTYVEGEPMIYGQAWAIGSLPGFLNNPENENSNGRSNGNYALMEFEYVFCTGHRYTLPWYFGLNNFTPLETDHPEANLEVAYYNGGGYIVTKPQLPDSATGISPTEYEIEKIIGVPDYANEETEWANNDGAIQKTRSNTTYFFEDTDFWADRQPRVRDGSGDNNVLTSNLFMYAVSMCDDEVLGNKITGADYQQDDVQNAIWASTGKPCSEEIPEGVCSTDHGSGTISGSEDPEASAKLNQAARSLDYYEYLISDKNMDGSEKNIRTGHEINADESTEVPSVNPRVAIQHAGPLLAEEPHYFPRNVTNGTDEYVENAPAASNPTDTQIGTVYDGTGTTYDANTGNYKIGPFFMSDYVYVYTESAINLSGKLVDKYKGMIGGIVAGEIILTKDDGSELEPIKIGNSEPAKIVYTDMNGNETNKGDYEREFEDDGKHIDDGSSVYHLDKIKANATDYLSVAPGGPNDADGKDGTWEDYEYPWPNSTFYIEVPKSECEDATTLKSIGFEYRRTRSYKDDGFGWTISTRFSDVIWQRHGVPEGYNDANCVGGGNHNCDLAAKGCTTYNCEGTHRTVCDCSCSISHSTSPAPGPSGSSYNSQVHGISGTVPQCNWSCTHSNTSCDDCYYDCPMDYCPGDDDHGSHGCDCGQRHLSCGCSEPPEDTRWQCSSHSHTLDNANDFCVYVHWHQDEDLLEEEKWGQTMMAVENARTKVWKTGRRNRMNVRLTTYVSIDKYIREVYHRNGEGEENGDMVFPIPYTDEIAIGEDNQLDYNFDYSGYTPGDPDSDHGRKLKTDVEKLENAVKVEKGDNVEYRIDLYNKQAKRIQIKIKDIFPTKYTDSETLSEDGTDDEGEASGGADIQDEYMISGWLSVPANWTASRKLDDLIPVREEGVVESGSSELYNSTDPTLEESKRLLLGGNVPANKYKGWVPWSSSSSTVGPIDRLAQLIDTGYNENRAFIITRNRVEGPTKEAEDINALDVNYTRVREPRPKQVKVNGTPTRFIESTNGPVVNLAEFDEPKNHVQENEPNKADKSKHKTPLESSDFYTVKEYDINIDKYIRNVEHDWSNNSNNEGDYTDEEGHKLIMSEPRDTSEENKNWNDEQNIVDSTIYPNSENTEGGGTERSLTDIENEEEKLKKENKVYVEYGDIVTYCITVYNTKNGIETVHDGELPNAKEMPSATGLDAKGKTNRENEPYYSPDLVYVDLTDELPNFSDHGGKILEKDKLEAMFTEMGYTDVKAVEAYVDDPTDSNDGYDFVTRTGTKANYESNSYETDYDSGTFQFKKLEVPANGTVQIIVNVVVEDDLKGTERENNIILDREDITEEGWGYHVRNINYKDSDSYDDYKIKNNTSKDDTSDWYKLNDYNITLDKYVSGYNHVMMDWNNGKSSEEDDLRNQENTTNEGEPDKFFVYDVENPEHKEAEIIDNKGFLKDNYDTFNTAFEKQRDREYIYNNYRDPGSIGDSPPDRENAESREGKQENSRDWREIDPTPIEEWREKWAVPVEKREKLIYSIRLTNESEVNVVAEGEEVPPLELKTGTKHATQVRPTMIQEELEPGLTLIKKEDTDRLGIGETLQTCDYMVEAVIYNRDGSVDEIKTPMITKIDVQPVGGDDSGLYTFKILDEVILDPGQYLVYYAMVHVDKNNMYLGTLKNESRIVTLTNINHSDADSNPQGDREERIIFDTSATDAAGNMQGGNDELNKNNIAPEDYQNSRDYVKMKELIIAGKVWLDENRDGVKDKEEYVFENINVNLLKGTGDGRAEPIAKVKTDDSGFYTFGRVYRAEGSDKKQEQTDIGGIAIQQEYNDNYEENAENYEYVVQFEYDGLMYKTTEIYGGNTESVGRFDLGGISENNFGMDNLEELGETWLQLPMRQFYNQITKVDWEETSIYNPGEFEKYAYDSNAYEFHDLRKNFNENYETISYNQAQNEAGETISLEYSENGHVSKLVEADRDTLDDGKRKMTAESFVKKGADYADTFTNEDNIRTLWLYPDSGAEYAETEYLKYVNLGLVEREEFDLSLTKDLFEIKTTINGEEVTYQYDKLKERYSEDQQGVYDKRQNDIGEGVLTDPLDGRELNKDYKLIEAILGKIGNPDADSEYDIVNPYKLKLYESDYKYRKDLYENEDVQDYKGINSELNIEVTYKIAIDSLVIDNDEPEQASDNDVKIEAKINEIVDHYDANFMKFGEDAGTGFVSGEENEILLKLFNDLGYLREDLDKSKIKIAEAWLGDRNGEKFEDNNELVVETTTDYNNDPLNNSSYHTAYIKGSDREEGIVRLDEGGRTYLGDPIKDKSARRNLAQDPTKVGQYIDENDNYLEETDGIFNTDERVDRDVAYVYVKYIVDKEDDYELDYIGESPEDRMLKIKPQDGNEDSMEGMSSIAEIGAYSTYYEENNDGNIEVAGVVDRDSNPGNVPEHIDNYEETAEDDTCRTKVNITVSMEEAPVPGDPTGGEPPTGGSEDFLIRVLTGTVWDDTRSEEAGTEGETQYVGNGINTADSEEDKRNQPNAKANANVNYLNGEELDIEKDSEDDYLENKDLPIKNMKAEIIEIVEIPGEIFGEEGSRYYEQILDPDKVTWKANRKQFTRTDEKGNYALSGFIPGYYVVRFTYGDAYADADDSYSGTAKDNGSQIGLTFDGKIISEEMSVFNGQDYKSSKYTTGLTDGTTARMGDGTEANIPGEFPYGIDEEHKITGSYLGENSSYDLRFAHYEKVIQAIENKAENDARDDESTRLKSMSYSETMTNKLAEVLKSPYAKYAKDGLAGETQKQYYNSDDLKDSKIYDIDETNERYSDTKVNDYLDKLLTNTAMNADTIIFHIKPEKGDSIPEREGIYEDYTGDKDTKYVFDRLFNKQYMNTDTTDVKANALPNNVTYDNFEHMLLEDLEKRHYKVENIDFGIEYRPESQVSLHKEIKSIEVTPSGSEVPLVKIVMKNAITESGIIHEVDIANSIGLENVQFLPNAYDLNIGSYNIEDFKVWNEDEQGFVYINIDAEILQGCTIKIDYGFTATNEGEVDRINRNLDDIRYAENDATPKAEGDRKYTTEGKIYNSVTGAFGAIYTPAATARNQIDKEFYVRQKEYEEGEDIEDVRNTKIIYRKKLKLYDREDVKKRILENEEPEEFYGRYMGNTYYTGDVEEPDTIVRVKFDKILDYVDNNLVFEEVKQFGKDPADIIDRGWKTSSSGELGNYSLLKDTVFNMTLLGIGKKPNIVPKDSNSAKTASVGKLPIGYISDKKGELYDTEQRSNLIVSNDDSTKDYEGKPQPTGETNSERNKSLSRFLLPKVTATSQELTVKGESNTIINGTTYSGRINIVPTKFFAQESDTQDMQFENVAEVIQFTVTNGRRTNFRTTIGNAEVGHENRGEFPPAVYEPDTSTVEQITLTPPTGFDMTRLKRAVSKVVEDIKQVVTDNKAVVAVIIVIAVIGIVVVIGKYVFEKIKNRPIK